MAGGGLAKVRPVQDGRASPRATRSWSRGASGHATCGPTASLPRQSRKRPRARHGLFRAPLPAGHRRRIFLGFSDVTTNNTFALGYEEVDAQGNVVPGSQKPAPDRLEQFDPSHTTICLPLGPGRAPVHETWEVVPLSTENHNFHIHQTRFKVAGTDGVPQDTFPLEVAIPDAGISEAVAKRQNGVCTIAQWRSGHCAAPTKVFDIPFSQLGEFVSTATSSSTRTAG